MKILHVVQGYDPAIGGAERLIQMVSERLAANHGDEVTVYTTVAYNCEHFWRRDQSRLPAGHEEKAGVKIRRFEVFNHLNRLRHFFARFATKLRLPYNDLFRAWHNGPLVPGMTQAIAEFKGDLIAASSFPLLHMHYALKGGKRSNTPVVFYPCLHPDDSWGFDRPMIYKAIREATACITNTRFEREYLAGRGVNQNRLFPVGLGVDLQPFEEADKTAIRKKFGFGEDPVVLFVGQQVEHKGVDVVVDAMPHVWNKFPKARLLIAGSRTSFSKIIEQKIAQLPGPGRNNVKTMYNFSDEEKPQLFAAGDLLAFPSCLESFGIVFLEPWAAKKAVLGSRVDAVSSVIDDGQNGLLRIPHSGEDFAKGICALLEDPDLRQRLGENGYKKVQANHTWDVVTAKNRRIYEKAVIWGSAL